MSTIEINQVVTDLTELFQVGKNEEYASVVNGNNFMIDKRQYERMEVIKETIEKIQAI